MKTVNLYRATPSQKSLIGRVERTSVALHCAQANENFIGGEEQPMRWSSVKI
jgi:hypothetical protein